MAAETASEVLEIAQAHSAQPGSPIDTLSIDPTAAEALLSAAQLGQRIKRLRLKRSMGLVELGRLTGRGPPDKSAPAYPVRSVRSVRRRAW